MRTLLVDDEPLARRELRRLLSAFPWVQVVGEAAHVEEAEARIAALCPELLLLDVQLPGASGFDLLERLERVPLVIFTTAYDHHAVRAFEVNALDYLLKPVDPARLAAALARVERTSPSRPPPIAADDRTSSRLERLFVRDGPRCWFVPLHEVRLLASEGNYVRLSWGAESPFLGRSLVSLEPRLDPERFFRANRTEVINVDFIERIAVGVGGRLHAHLRGGPEVEISRRQARLFRARMGA